MAAGFQAELKALDRDLKFLQSTNTIIDAGEALKTITDVYLENLIEYPNDDKYGSIGTLNIHFQERVARIQGASRLLADIGFKKFKFKLKYDTKQNNSLNWLKSARMKLQEALSDIQNQIAKLPIRLGKQHTYTSVQGCGYFESQGPRSSMEDDHISCDSFCGDNSQGFFAVYDGHGGRGSVDFVAKSLHLNLRNSMQTVASREMKDHFIHAYLKTDAQIRRRNILQSGTTAVTCIVRKVGNSRLLHVANAGDSRAVISRKDRKAVRLTIDHKPNLPEETKRICSLPGGFVSPNPPPRVLGYLAVSRAIGDHSFKERDYVVATPYCQTINLEALSHSCFTPEEMESFPILRISQYGSWAMSASLVNGLRRTILRRSARHGVRMMGGHGSPEEIKAGMEWVWDVMEDQNAIDFLHKFWEGLSEGEKENTNQALERASEALVEEALRRDTRDNVTVMILKF
ncbi:hypothetical protein AAMO2058_000874100 [Amorphochlora amoebiformis]